MADKTYTAMIEIPVEATLMVQISSAHPRPLTPDDLPNFGLVDRHVALFQFKEAMLNVLAPTGVTDLTDSRLWPVIDLVEAVFYFGFDDAVDHIGKSGEHAIQRLETGVRVKAKKADDGTPTD